MDIVFNQCVRLLQGIGYMFGWSYEETNVIIFVIIAPLVFIGMVYRLIYLEKMLEGQVYQITEPIVKIVLGFLTIAAVLLVATLQSL